MLYRTIKRMIERSRFNGIKEKIDVFFGAGKITDVEYRDLIHMLYTVRSDNDIYRINLDNNGVKKNE